MGSPERDDRIHAVLSQGFASGAVIPVSVEFAEVTLSAALGSMKEIKFIQEQGAQASTSNLVLWILNDP